MKRVLGPLLLLLLVIGVGWGIVRSVGQALFLEEKFGKQGFLLGAPPQ